MNPLSPPELQHPGYRIIHLTGDVKNEPGWARQDPSNVLRIGDRFFVWYAKYPAGINGYAADIFYASSTDGFHWTEHGQALGHGAKGAWDDYGVVAPYVVPDKGKFYLFYNGTNADQPWNHPTTLRHTGIAIAESPEGPWRRFEGNPMLSPGPAGSWDSLLVTDPHIIVRQGQYWLYFKGGDPEVTGETTRWGVAFAREITGPYLKYVENPILDSGHTTCLWPHREGVAALVDNAGPQRYSVQYSPDGLHFTQTAKLDFIHTGCGPFDPAAFNNVPYGNGIRWGLAQEEHPDGSVNLVRFELDCPAPPRSEFAYPKNP